MQQQGHRNTFEHRIFVFCLVLVVYIYEFLNYQFGSDIVTLNMKLRPGKRLRKLTLKTFMLSIFNGKRYLIHLRSCNVKHDRLRWQRQRCIHVCYFGNLLKSIYSKITCLCATIFDILSPTSFFA